MSNLKTNVSNPKSIANFTSNYQAIYWLGGIAALLTVLTAVSEIAVTFLPGGSVIPESVVDWYLQLQNNWFLGLRNLGLLNIIMITLGIPMYFSLYIAHSKVDKERAAFALILCLISAVVFFSTNRAFPMLELSHQYAQAVTDSQRIVIESAGQAMLSVGRSHSPGTFIGFAFGECAAILMSIVMLRNKIFGKITALMGILGFALLFVFEVYSFFTATLTNVALVIALFGGVFNLIWLALLGLRFLQLARKGL